MESNVKKDCVREYYDTKIEKGKTRSFRYIGELFAVARVEVSSYEHDDFSLVKLTHTIQCMVY